MSEPAGLKSRLPVHRSSGLVPPEERTPRLARAPLERCTAADRFHDYVLTPYQPEGDTEGKLRSLNLLVESFALAGVEEEGVRVMNLLREQLGPFRTVWGIKQHLHSEAPHGWELYFYDFERRHADLSIDRIRSVLSPALAIDAVEPFPIPWRMFSVEFSPAQLRDRAPAALDVYVDMRSYKVRGARWEFENVYTFHDSRAEIDLVLHRLRSSVHFDHRRGNLAQLIPPSLFRCTRICVANKRRADAVYFSRITTSALLEFLGTHRWPAALVAFVRESESDLAHLLWDVGADFSREGDAVVTRKTGVYGTF